MLRLLSLILPTIFPSWRFFKEIEPSPRLEFRLIRDGQPGNWQEVMPRRSRLTPLVILRRLFWNRSWNEYLFLVSCSERLIIQPTCHSIDEITARLTRFHAVEGAGLQFRIRLADRGVEGITLSDAYLSEPVHAV